MILLDEPTSHLDLYHKVAIFKLLKKLTSQLGKGVVFTTHEISMAIQLCDKILLIDNGKVTVDQPCTLISDGHFERLFPEEQVHFDRSTGHFNITDELS